MESAETDREIRILQIWNDYLPVFSGAAIFHNQLADLLLAEGIRIEVITRSAPGAPAVDRIASVSIRRLPAGRLPWKTARSLSNAVQLGRELWLRRNEFDLIHAVTTNEFFAPVLAWFAKMGKPVVVEFTLLSNPKRSAASEALSRLANYWLKRAAAFVVISSRLMQEIDQRGLPVQRARCFHRGVPTDRFIPATEAERKILRGRFGLAEDRKYLIFVGSVIHRKGVDILVAMMEHLVRFRGDVDLIILGEDDFPHLPPEHEAHAFVESIRREVASAQLGDRIRFLGRMDYDAVIPWLQVSDLFVFPSRREGLGKVILEAMAVELPCICSDLDGIAPEMITAGVDGLIVRDGRAESYADEVLGLLNDPEGMQRMGRAARARVIEQFDILISARQYAELFAAIARA